MNPRSLRRLASDHATLHSSPLPPNYLFAPFADDSSDLTSLNILLAGPTSTPYESGLFKLHLNIPPTYPNDPPKAFFRTKIFHPNVDENSGAVCVETLKRDWEPKLTLRDVLVTVSCLLLQPNASSALNAEAGKLLEQAEGAWEAFDKRARLMTRLHAGVPKELKDLAREAQMRGEEKLERKDSAYESAGEGSLGKRKRGGGKIVETATPEKDAAMFTTPHTMQPPPLPISRMESSRPFILQTPQDDVFGIRLPCPTARDTIDTDTDEEFEEQDQENDSALSPAGPRTSIVPSPLRQGPPVPLGELQISDPADPSNESFESEYPPSPKKSPVKRRVGLFDRDQENEGNVADMRPEYPRAESSRDAALRQPLFTPRAQTGLGDISSISVQRPARLFPSKRNVFARAAARRCVTPDIDPFNGPRLGDRVTKARAPVARSKSADQKRKEQLEARLWLACGQSVERWNRGDFGGYFAMKAARW